MSAGAAKVPFGRMIATPQGEVPHVQAASSRGVPSVAWRKTNGQISPHVVLFHTAMQGAGTKGRPVVFFDVSVGDTPVGRIKLELYNDIVPKYVCAF